MRPIILGDGLLGSYLREKTQWDFISRKKDGINFSDLSSYSDKLETYDIVVNCIANTNTYSKDKGSHWSVNYEGVANLVDYCNTANKKIIHISTDYLYSFSEEDASENDVPVHSRNWYGYTKLLGEGYVLLRSKNYLVIRTTQKKNPFPFDKAYVNQIGNFDYVDTIGDLIILLIQKGASGIYNVGTEKKSMFELAKVTNPGVNPTEDLFDPTTPTNTTMDVSKMTSFLGGSSEDVINL
jgi:dTDP-4-dehydrorhamnose reductase